MIKVIKKESEYLDALKEIERLIELEPKKGTAESHKLELLGLLIQDYETTRYFQTSVSDPVDAIIFRMEQGNLSPRDLIKYIGSRSKVSEILSRKRPLSISMIRALNKGLGIPLKSLVNESNDRDDSSEIDWNRFPFKEMIKRNWFDIDVSDIRHNVQNVAKDWIMQTGMHQSFVLHRKTEHVRSARTIDIYALNAWTARIISLAKKLKIKKTYQSSFLNPDTIRELIRLSIKNNAPALVEEFLEDIGIAFAIEPQLPRTHIDGVALIYEKMPIIGMTLRYDRIDNFWFTLIHEVAHIHLHLNNSDFSFYDDLDLDDPTDLFENEADGFASEMLIPEAEWINSPASKLCTPEAAIHLADKLKIHPAIVAGRMRYKFNNYKLLNKLVGHNEVRNCFLRVNWS